MKCGIHPINPQKILEQLPDVDVNEGDNAYRNTSVSDVAVGMLIMLLIIQTLFFRVIPALSFRMLQKGYCYRCFRDGTRDIP